MDFAAYARRQSQIHVRTQKEIARIDTELYGRHGPHPALTQVVPGKHYNRGDCSHIRCIKCGTRTHGERQCPACEAVWDRWTLDRTKYGESTRRGVRC